MRLLYHVQSAGMRRGRVHMSPNGRADHHDGRFLWQVGASLLLC